MIEIILRDDVNDYEPKPVFGHSYRTAATALVLAVACGGLGFAGVQLGVPDSLLTPLLVGLGALIGFVGMGRPGSLRTEQWLRAWDWDRRWPRHALFCPPELVRWGEGRAAAQGGRRRGAGQATEIEVSEETNG